LTISEEQANNKHDEDEHGTDRSSTPEARIEDQTPDSHALSTELGHNSWQRFRSALLRGLLCRAGQYEADGEIVDGSPIIAVKAGKEFDVCGGIAVGVLVSNGTKKSGSHLCD